MAYSVCDVYLYTYQTACAVPVLTGQGALMDYWHSCWSTVQMSSMHAPSHPLCHADQSAPVAVPVPSAAMYTYSVDNCSSLNLSGVGVGLHTA